MSDKKYKIETVQDIADVVNIENYERFMIDFLGVFQAWVQVKDKYPKTEFPSFVWIDDDKQNIKIEFSKKP